MPSTDMATRGKLGALVTNSRYDGREITARARETFISSFADQARAEAAARGEEITDVEAARRGEFLRRAFYVRLSLKSVRARSRRLSTDAA